MSKGGRETHCMHCSKWESHIAVRYGTGLRCYVLASAAGRLTVQRRVANSAGMLAHAARTLGRATTASAGRAAQWQ